MPKKSTATNRKPVIKVKVVPRYGKRCLAKGIYVTNDTRVSGLNNNDLVIAGSGAGKTGSIVYTQLKTLSDSSLIVADSKNMLHRMFREELGNKGYKVRVLDFVNPEQSCMYNPLDYVRKNADGSYNEMDIMKISRALIPTLDRNEPYWEIQGRAVLDFFISYTLAALPEEDHNIYTVCRLYRAFTRDMGESGFIGWIENHQGSFTANRYVQIKNMRTADKMWSSILGFVNVALYPFDVADLHHIFDPNMRKNAEEDENASDDDMMDDFDYDEDEYRFEDEGFEYASDFCAPYTSDEEKAKNCVVREELSIESLGKEKTVVFLNISDTDHSIDSLVNLFYTQALQTLVSEADKKENGQLTVPCRIVFDDFASGTVIPDFDKVISVIRSRDIWVTISIQSLSQLESLYTNAQSLTILNNCDHIVYLGSNDISSAEFIGTRAGKVPEEILAMDRTKESTTSQGVVVEGKNSVTLNNVVLNADNNQHNSDKSDVFEAVMIYQSMSGDAAEGQARFAATGGQISNANGDVFFVNNTATDIALSNVNIINNGKGAFLRAAAAGWGNEGSNGGKVNLTATSQKIDGDMIVDDISSLNLYLEDGSTFNGAINPDGAAGDVYVELGGGSKWTLTKDSYIRSLTCDADAIDLNGYTLTVDGKEYAQGSASSGEAVEIKTQSGGREGMQAPPDGEKPPMGEKGMEPPKDGERPSGSDGEPPAKPDGQPPEKPDGMGGPGGGTPPDKPE